MKRNVISAAAIFLFSMASYGWGGTATFTKGGILVDAGAAGKFNLPYPALSAGGTPSSVEVGGTTVDLAYVNGTKVHATISQTGDVSYEMSSLPADTKSFRMELNFPESFKGVAKWSIDGSEAREFPVKKMEDAFLFKGNAKKFALSGGKEGKEGFTITMPSGWMQLQDNRFWNGHEFLWFTTTEIPAVDSKAHITFNISGGTGEPITVKAAPLNLLAVKLSEKGLVVSNGTAGELTLTLPTLVMGNKTLTSTNAMLGADNKSLDLKYPDGATCHIILAAKELTISFKGLPKGTTAFRMDSLIPANYSAGGTYAIGGELATAFPKDKPARPFLYEGNASRITLLSPAGTDLCITLPGYSYQQLQDNREWNWAVFAWWMSAPIAPDQTAPIFTIKFDGGNTPAI